MDLRNSKLLPIKEIMSEEFEVSIVNGRGVIKVTQNLMSELPAELLRSAFEDLVERGQKSVVIDLTKTVSINSFGLGRLLALQNKLVEAGGDMSIRVSQGYIKEIIRILHLDKVFKLEEI